MGINDCYDYYHFLIVISLLFTSSEFFLDLRQEVSIEIKVWRKTIFVGKGREKEENQNEKREDPGRHGGPKM